MARKICCPSYAKKVGTKNHKVCMRGGQFVAPVACKRSRGLGGIYDWAPEGRYKTCALARRMTEARIGRSIERGFLEVRYTEVPSRSRPGETSCLVEARATR
jgi:hypothetical protein